MFVKSVVAYTINVQGMEDFNSANFLGPCIRVSSFLCIERMVSRNSLQARTRICDQGPRITNPRVLTPAKQKPACCQGI